MPYGSDADAIDSERVSVLFRNLPIMRALSVPLYKDSRPLGRETPLCFYEKSTRFADARICDGSTAKRAVRRCDSA